jgi:hypothetical protein
MFFKGSRYQDVPNLEYETDDGRVIGYKARRIIPPTPGLTRHLVEEGERLDRVAFEHFRDPERFWRLCDANVVIHPDDLMARPGRIIDVPASEG